MGSGKFNYNLYQYFNHKKLPIDKKHEGEQRLEFGLAKRLSESSLISYSKEQQEITLLGICSKEMHSQTVRL